MRINRFIRKQAEDGHDRDINICGVLVHAQPKNLAAVRLALQEHPGVEIHQETSDGRLIVTVEDTADSWAGETIKNLQEIPGVLSASLVYHHFDESQVQGESIQ
ncbi:MAG: chaperone NapD [Alphaproteobacteria bacterium]|nr:chaperone NapD [Alphaproteobacteria bacterium]